MFSLSFSSIPTQSTPIYLSTISIDRAFQARCCSLLSGLEGSDALVKQVAEADRVIVEKVSDRVGLRLANILLLGGAHGLVCVDLLGGHALGESVVSLDPGDVGVRHLGFQ